MPISKINSKALVDCSVAAVDIADNSITAAKLAGSIANAKLANSSVTINSTSVSLGASANINALDWQSVIVADGLTGTTGVAGRGYFINTTSAAHTFTLPVSATRGDTIAIKDYAGTFATFNLTIGRNGHKIQGVENNSLISTNRASVVLVYADVTRGWEFTTESNVADLGKYVLATGGTITTTGDFKIHSFTGDGCFVVSKSGFVEYLVVAGGGAGGGAVCGGGAGGGAGGFRSNFPNPLESGFPVNIQTYPITVGSGGSIVPAPTAPTSPTGGLGGSGSPSVFSTITSAGGGGGAALLSQPGGQTGSSGGSGGGGSMWNKTANVAQPAGLGNTPPVSPSQGNPGGSATSPGGGNRIGGGGGGAGAAGTNAFSGPTGTIGNGGTGLSSSITDSPVFYSGGGGGSGDDPSTGGTGGSGVGGNGATGTTSGNSGSAGTANRGGGGGGQTGTGYAATAGAGGKGIVIIRYKFQ